MSCVRASGRGEAAWACEGTCFSTLEARTARSATPAWVFPWRVFVDSLQGFKEHVSLLDDGLQGFKEFALLFQTVARVLRLLLRFC